MAIPFVLPSEDENRSEIELEQLLGELVDINQQIQILLRARMLHRANQNPIRVCSSRHHHNRNHHNQQHQPMMQMHAQLPMQPSILPDLVRSSVPSATSIPESSRRQHQRINTDLVNDTEASCCYHAKFTTHMLAEDNDASAIPLMTATAEVDVDWKQVGDIVRRFADIFKTPYQQSISPCASPPSCLPHDNPANTDSIEDKSLLSKIIPATTSSRSLWTAVICVVGWHIFRAR